MDLNKPATLGARNSDFLFASTQSVLHFPSISGTEQTMRWLQQDTSDGKLLNRASDDEWIRIYRELLRSAA